MANVVLTSVGTDGDVLPLVQIGGRLRERGHEVTLLSHSRYGELAASTGLEFDALDDDEAYARFIEDGPLLNSPRGVAEFLRRHYFPVVPLEYERIRERCRRAHSVVVTRHLFDVGARLAAEKLKVPLLWIFVAPSQLLNGAIREELFLRVIADDVNRLRDELGFPSVADWHGWLAYPGRNPALWPDWFASYDSSWCAEAVPVGFVVDNRGEAANLPDEVQAILDGGEAPVLITGGTGTFLGSGFYAVSAEACRLARRRAILVTRHDTQVPQNLPDSVRRFQFLPLGKLMPSMESVIHHGGRGTLSCALASGIPQVILASGADRPDNALRLRRLGVAAYLPPPLWSPTAVARELGRLAQSPIVRERCRELARLVAAADSLTAACELIESSLTHQRL